MIWGGLRWSDAQRLEFSSLKIDEDMIRRWCWRTKTSVSDLWDQEMEERREKAADAVVNFKSNRNRGMVPWFGFNEMTVEHRSTYFFCGGL